jgi:predicted lipoprotein
MEVRVTRRLVAVLVLLALATAACGGEEEAEPLSPAQTREYFTNIDTLLDETVSVHEQDDTEQAAELAGEAYLENFEHLEPDLEEANHELNEELEAKLGPPFRQAIQEGMSQEELESRVDEIRALLDQARAELGVA